MDLAFKERFWKDVYHCPVSGCWLWGGVTQKKGYGVLYWKGVYRYAHRISYEIHKGPIPIGLVIDHICRNKACVNPEHLRACTITENVLAPGSLAKCAKFQHITDCPVCGTQLVHRSGTKNGKRCPECLRLYMQKYEKKRPKRNNTAT